MITGSFLLLGDDGVGFEGVAPDAPTSFTASDAENCQITLTWTDSTVGNPTPTYELWSAIGAEPILTNISSPHVWIPTLESETYFIRAVNSEGQADSNFDMGTAMDGRPSEPTLNGTTDESGQITFTWTEEAGCTYDIYEHQGSDQPLDGGDVTSPFVYVTDADVKSYYIKSTNFCGVAVSLVIEAYATEIPTSGEVIASGEYVYLTVNTTDDSFALDRANWHVYVGGVQMFGGNVYKLAGAGDTLRIGVLPIIYRGQLVTLTHDVQEGTIEAFTNMAIVNASNITLDAPPIYLMTEQLDVVSTYSYLPNSSTTGAIYNGRLEHSSQSTDGTEGDPWTPTTGQNGQYGQDGLLELSVNGNATRQVNTQWTPPYDAQWFIRGAYDITKGLNYAIYQLHYKGNGKIDIYSGSYGVPITLTHSDVDYTPSQDTPWIIQANGPELVGVTNVIYKMDSFTTV